jgi:hypothetical protein
LTFPAFLYRGETWALKEIKIQIAEAKFLRAVKRCIKRCIEIYKIKKLRNLEGIEMINEK